MLRNIILDVIAIVIAVGYTGLILAVASAKPRSSNQDCDQYCPPKK